MPEPPLSLPNLDDIPDPLPAGTPDVALPPAAKPASPGPTRSDVSRARRLALVVGSGWVLGQLAIAGLEPGSLRLQFTGEVVELAGAESDEEGADGQGQGLADQLKAPFYAYFDERGRLLKVQTVPGAYDFVTRLWHGTVAALQFVGPSSVEQDRWTTVETDTVGEYDAAYEQLAVAQAASAPASAGSQPEIPVRTLVERATREAVRRGTVVSLEPMRRESPNQPAPALEASGLGSGEGVELRVSGTPLVDLVDLRQAETALDRPSRKLIARATGEELLDDAFPCRDFLARRIGDERRGPVDFV